MPLLAGRGHTCEVFLSPAIDFYSQPVNHNGVRVNCINGEGRSPFSGLSLPMKTVTQLHHAWHLAEEIGRHHQLAPFDIIHVPNFGFPGLFLDVDAPIVMRFSSHAQTWHAARGDSGALWTTLDEMLQRRAIANADHFISPSHFVAKRIESELGLPVSVVRPPAESSVDSTRWDTDWVGAVTAGGPFVLHAGQLGRAKGTDRVCQAFAAIGHRYPELSIHFAGSDAGGVSQVRDLARRFRGQVIIHGKLEQERLQPLIQAALAVVCASRADNLPNVLIETMSLAVPVVVIPDASLDELVEDGIGGIVAESTDSVGLAAALERILNLTDTERQELGRQGCQRVMDRLHPAKAVLHLEDEYSKAITLGKRNRPNRNRVVDHVIADLLAVSRLAEPAGKPKRPDFSSSLVLRGVWSLLRSRL